MVQYLYKVKKYFLIAEFISELSKACKNDALKFFEEEISETSSSKYLETVFTFLRREKYPEKQLRDLAESLEGEDRNKALAVLSSTADRNTGRMYQDAREQSPLIRREREKDACCNIL
jgi:hypothetical protein